MSSDEMPTASGGKKANIRSAGKYQEEQYNVNRDRGGMSANNIARGFFFFLSIRTPGQKINIKYSSTPGTFCEHATDKMFTACVTRTN